MTTEVLRSDGLGALDAPGAPEASELGASVHHAGAVCVLRLEGALVAGSLAPESGAGGAQLGHRRVRRHLAREPGDA